MSRICPRRLSFAILPTVAIMVWGGWLAVSPADADDRGYAILSRTLYAAFGVDYSGVREIVIYKDGRRVNSYTQTVFHKRGNKQRMSVNNGPMVVSNGQTMWEYFPNKAKVVVHTLPAPRQALNEKLEGLRRIAGSLYLQYEGQTAVAGRTVNVVAVKSPAGVLIKRVWADAERGVELATERYDQRGRIAFSSYFTRVNFSPTFVYGCFEFQPPAGVTVVNTPPPRRRMSLVEAQQTAGFAAVVPAYLPAGYRFDEDGVSVTTRAGQAVLWLTFSNGIDTFSLFESGIPREIPKCVPKRVNVWTSGTYLFVLVGRLPQDDVARIKSSMAR